MKNFILICALVFSFFSLNAQSYFPDLCLGIWEGKMTIYNNGEVVDSVGVRMTIDKIPDSLQWTWKTEYLSEKYPVTKDYKLILEDPSSNKFTMDENNGINLYTYVFGQKMYSNFEVQGNYISSVYSLNGDELIFEIISGKDLGKTGNDICNFSVTNLQKSILKRKK